MFKHLGFMLDIKKDFSVYTEDPILDATIDVIARHGIRKTSVNSIATAAGVCRQTVYNLFGNKPNIIRAVFLYNGSKRRAEAVSELATKDTLSDQLDVIFKCLCYTGYKFLHSHPEADDIVFGTHVHAAEVFKEVVEEDRKLIESLLRPYKDELKAVGLTPKRYSDVIEKSLRGCMRDAESLRHFSDMLKVWKITILAMCDQTE